MDKNYESFLPKKEQFERKTFGMPYPKLSQLSEVLTNRNTQFVWKVIDLIIKDLI